MIRKWSNANLRKRTRHVVATATAFTFLCQNFAWAVCADGSTFPPGGFVYPQPPTAIWSQGVFTGSAGSVFIPDNSIFEHNDPGQPVTGGGHNWVFDQGSATCKAIDVGPAGGTPTGWQISSASEECIFLPITRNRIIVSCCNIPYQGQAITPTCDPALLSQPGAPNLANTRRNQLGCAISHGVATTQQSATTFMFVAGIQSGLWAVSLANVPNPATGGDAGKVVVSESYYSDIPEGQKLTNGAVSPDGMFAIATSIRRNPNVFACLNPLGDPGDPSQPIDPNFSIPPASQVKCMIIGNNGLQVDLTTLFGPDNQPYFGGARGVNTFNQDPGGSSPSAWPQCTFNGFGFPNPPPTTLMGKLQAVFNVHSAGHCVTAVPNVGLSLPAVVQPQDIISHGSYMYAGSVGAPVLQFKVTVDPASGLSQYASRTYLSGAPLSFITGLGVADDLKSLMAFNDQSGLGLAAQELVVKAPLCEDM